MTLQLSVYCDTTVECLVPVLPVTHCTHLIWTWTWCFLSSRTGQKLAELDTYFLYNCCYSILSRKLSLQVKWMLLCVCLSPPPIPSS